MAHTETLPQNPNNPKIDLRLINFKNNDNIIEVLEKLIAHTNQLNVQQNSQKSFKIKQYKVAIDSLQNCNVEIKSAQQAKALKGIGDGIAKRIDEILRTGTLKELDTVIDPVTALQNMLLEVHGIGPSKATEYVQFCISNGLKLTSIEDFIYHVQTCKIKIDHSIAVGLKYYNDFKLKIPYDEVYSIVSKIKSVLEPQYKDLVITACGSHRRKKAFSGDIDLLITTPVFNPTILKGIIEILSLNNILIDHLTEKGNTKYMGVCCNDITNIVGRRIDIRYVNYEDYPAALLYFTGSMWLNKQMRTIAIKNGYTLNEYGLFRGKDKFDLKTERDIFNALNIVYLEPEQRDL